MRCTPTTVPFIIAMLHCTLNSNVRNSSQTLPPWLDNVSRWCSVFSEAHRPHRGGDALFLMDLDSSSWCTSVIVKSARSVHPGSCRQTDGEGFNTRKNLVTSQRSMLDLHSTNLLVQVRAVHVHRHRAGRLVVAAREQQDPPAAQSEGCFEGPCRAVHKS